MFSRELKKGSTELLVLALIEDRPRHGYDIGKRIESGSGGRLTFRIGSLYPILVRLEDKRLITGRWIEKSGERRRRYYKLTAEGRKRVPLGPTITRHVIDSMGAEGASRCVTLLQMHGNVLFLSIAMVTGEGSNPRDPGTKPNSRSTFLSAKAGENIAQVDPDTYTPAYFLYAGRTKLSALSREGQ